MQIYSVLKNAGNRSKRRECQRNSLSGAAMACFRQSNLPVFRTHGGGQSSGLVADGSGCNAVGFLYPGRSRGFLTNQLTAEFLRSTRIPAQDQIPQRGFMRRWQLLLLRKNSYGVPTGAGMTGATDLVNSYRTNLMRRYLAFQGTARHSHQSMRC